MRKYYKLKLMRSVFFASFSLLGSLVPGCLYASADFTELSLEELMNTEYVPASKIARQISDAHSAVSLVTSEEIYRYGYRSLSEILSSMRGLYMSSDGIYGFLGGRGFGAAGDFAGRILLSIDGYAVNDIVFNQIYFGEDGFLDVSLIEQIEYVPGPGSLGYGSGAYLGSINIITKKGGAYDGFEIASEQALNRDTQRYRLVFGKRISKELEYLASASIINQSDDGGLNGDASSSGEEEFRSNKAKRVFFKGSYHGLNVESAYVKKTYGYEYAFEDSFANTTSEDYFNSRFSSADESQFVFLTYDFDLSQGLSSSARLQYGSYRFTNSSSGDGGEDEYSAENELFGSWAATDIKFIGTWFANHRFLFGAEYRDEIRNYSRSIYILDGEEEQINSVANTSHVYGLYLQDEFRLSSWLSLVGGLRYDKKGSESGVSSPRISSIFKPWEKTVIKLSYGEAFRFLSSSEENESFTKEDVRSRELIFDHNIGGNMSLIAAYYHNKTNEFTGFAVWSREVVGRELGVKYYSESDFTVSFSYAHQADKSRDLISTEEVFFDGEFSDEDFFDEDFSDEDFFDEDFSDEDFSDEDFVASVHVEPREIYTIGLSQSFFNKNIIAALNAKKIASRSFFDPSNQVEASTFLNFTLSYKNILPGLDIRFSIKNILGNNNPPSDPFYSSDSGVGGSDSVNSVLFAEYSF